MYAVYFAAVQKPIGRGVQITAAATGATATYPPLRTTAEAMAYKRARPLKRPEMQGYAHRFTATPPGEDVRSKATDPPTGVIIREDMSTQKQSPCHTAHGVFAIV